MRLARKAALVTGAAQGIGLSVAKRLASEGASVVLTDVNEAGGAQAADQLRAQGAQVEFMALDVTDDEAVATMMSDAEKLVDGPVEIVVCNAGVQTFTKLLDTTKSEWDKVLGVNAWGTFCTMREAGRHLRQAGRQGSVVTIASRVARLGAVHSPHYGASKAAVLNLTKSCALEFAGDRIRFNAVAPGMIDTALWEESDRATADLLGIPPGTPRATRVGQIPLGRAGRPDDVAAVVAFLASNDSEYMTGECVHVCGGDLMI